ncbi:hypothetical protein Pmani_016252 [Petrolisthes manimaculis]|uniref:Uncharacterized protein n=1 Tax=Petrolisthes manimaculis TaxID=1843537 RepID=A0AAE1PQH8_9EUCA|nr:hypothetical protein Pmani_016252 [Petrolisthes manimaculis]
MACWTKEKCVAGSVTDVDVDGGGGKECRMAEWGPTNTSLIHQPNSVYFYWKDSVPSSIYEITSDGLLTLLGNETMTFNESKEFCASIPGHRMAMTKKKTQIEVLLDLQNRTGEIIWGDQTPYNDTDAKEVRILDNEDDVDAFRFRDKHFDDRSKSAEFLPLCQANPLDNAEW